MLQMEFDLQEVIGAVTYYKPLYKICISYAATV